MSTSPSWFDQDKFSRLVKKVGPKPPGTQPAAGQSASAKMLIKPLIKEASLPSENIVEEKKPLAPKVSILPPQAQLPPEEEEIAEPAPRAFAPPVEEKIPTPASVPKAPPVEPPREARLSSRLPKIDLRKPAAAAPPVPPPLHAEAGTPVEEKPGEDEERPVLPGAANRPPTSTLRMMTSQPLSLGKKVPSASPPPSQVEPKVEPIRAPEASGISAPQAPPFTGSSTSGRLPQRTTSLPALKSLFQFEIPGRQGKVPGKLDAEIPEPKAPLPAFSFSQPEKKAPETLPSAPGDKEAAPNFAGLADAVHLAEIEKELTPENLAAEWEKKDQLKEELERITRERDDALAENDKLLRQLRETHEALPDQKTADAAELDFVTKERDQVRGDYIKLREDFEKLKQELQTKAVPAQAGIDPELEREIDQLRRELAEKDHELEAMKTTSTDANEAGTLKTELETLKNDLKKAKDDASVAQRGLALSQKALQETRNALREASESAGKK